MRLRTAILAGMLLVVFGAVATTLVAAKLVVDGSAKRAIREEIRRGRQVFAGLMAQRQTQNARATQVIADEPRLRAVAGSDVDRATIVEVVSDVYESLGLDVLVLVDGRGALVVDMLAPDAPPGADMLADAMVAEAFDSGSAPGVWVDGERAYEVHARRMGKGAHTRGVVVTGQAMDDVLAAAVLRQTGNALVILLDDQPIAVSPLPGVENVPRAALGASLARVHPDAAASDLVVLGDARFVVVAGRFDAYRGDSDLRYVLLRNLDQALEPGRRLTWILGVVLIVSVLAALMLALAGTRFLSLPVDALVVFTRRIAAGDLRPQPPMGGFAELRTLSEAMNRMAGQIDATRRLQAEKERLESELHIASRIQTSILPARVGLPGLEIAARMDAAEEVGGDYYDVIAAPDGGWIGIGDVAGHGLDAGLIMVMAQTGVAALVAAEPDAPPSRVLATLNRVLHDNIKERLDSDRHMTMSLLRYHIDGRLVAAGAHMDMLRVRRRDGACELLETPGTWLALVDDIAPFTADATHRLEPGDLLVLYTDGLTEAANPAGEQLGMARLTALVTEARHEPAAAICARLFDMVRDWAPRQEDDITVLVMRYRPDSDGAMTESRNAPRNPPHGPLGNAP